MTETLLFQETRGGARKNSGRKYNFQKIKTRAEAERLNTTGKTLLEIAVNYVRQWAERGDEEKAFAAAVPLLPYLHPRLAAVAVQTTKTELTLAELIEQSFKPQLSDQTENLKTIELSPIIESIDDLL